MITRHHGVTPFTSAQSDMHIDDIVMSTCRTQDTDASGHAQIHDSDLDVRRVDETSKPDLSWAAPGLCNNSRWDTQRSSAMPELFDAELHHLSLSRLIHSEERAGVESKTRDATTCHPAIRSSWSLGLTRPI
jgi:hypothetical protein